MRVLIVGSGAREHMMLVHLRASRLLRGGQIWIANGNGGTGQIAVNLGKVNLNEVSEVVKTAKTLDIDLVVVGPERPLAYGLIDELKKVGIPGFGPSQAAARLEASKRFTRKLLWDINAPQPLYRVFDSLQKALDFLRRHKGPVVVKADGLWEGKGVWVCSDNVTAARAVRFCFKTRPKEPVLLEERLYGQEASVLAFCDGAHLSNPVIARDYKRIGDDNEGENTEGMGAYSPVDFWTPGLTQFTVEQIMQPTVNEMARRGTPYVGILYAGVMLTKDGLKILEFNCRMGDPETQVVLRQLKPDLVRVMTACIEGNLHTIPVQWTNQPHVGVVLASAGYPGEYKVSQEISGLFPRPTQIIPDTMVVHAGTRILQGKRQRAVTSGGRVLTVVGWGDSITEARLKAYKRVEQIRFNGKYCRSDIAASVR